MTREKRSPEFLAFFGLIDAEEYVRRTEALAGGEKRRIVSQKTKDKLREAGLLRWRKRRGET